MRSVAFVTGAACVTGAAFVNRPACVTGTTQWAGGI